MSTEDETANLPPIPELEGWKSLPAVGDLLKVSRQRIFQMGVNERKFTTIHLILGGVDPDTGESRRPMGYVVRNEEVDEFLAVQKAAAAASAEDAIAS